MSRPRILSMHALAGMGCLIAAQLRAFPFCFASGRTLPLLLDLHIRASLPLHDSGEAANEAAGVCRLRRGQQRRGILERVKGFTPLKP